ncbi:MAG TPA: DUF4384 domain-containing protein [Bacteroidota bacterium]
MKTTLLITIVLSLMSLGFMAHHEPAPRGSATYQNDENVLFKWSFGAIVGKEKKFVAITKDTVLKTGDEMKMYVELKKDCFVYLIYQSSKGEISVLFPNDGFKQFTADYKTGKPYLVPKGRDWYRLDKNVGTETFYLLGSAERLIELEAMIGNYLSADNAKKPDLAKNIITEIRNVRKRYKSVATLAEKPITIGGNVRGVGETQEVKRPDVTTIATEISASNFYSKIISIEHQ